MRVVQLQRQMRRITMVRRMSSLWITSVIETIKTCFAYDRPFQIIESCSNYSHERPIRVGRYQPGSKGGEIHPQTLQEAEVGRARNKRKESSWIHLLASKSDRVKHGLLNRLFDTNTETRPE